MRIVQQFVQKQPAGYREGLLATHDGKFDEVVASTLQSYLALRSIEYGLDVGSRTMDLSSLLPLEAHGVLAQCPIYMRDDLEEVGVAPGSLRLVHSINEIVESRAFEKQFRYLRPEVQRDWDRKERKKRSVFDCLHRRGSKN